MLFSPEGNNLWVYAVVPPFTEQKVNAANETFDGTPGNPSGWDINLSSPSGITRGPSGHFFVASVITGAINEYDAGWHYVQAVLQRPAGETLGPEPYSTGTPLGITVGPDGTLYYADIGVVSDASGIGPGTKTGSVQRITFTDGVPNAPETMASRLQFPDGIGLWRP